MVAFFFQTSDGMSERYLYGQTAAACKCEYLEGRKTDGFWLVVRW